jgi:D-psicose/D-tagatose/L-ribulose 3-epimerase
MNKMVQLGACTWTFGPLPLADIAQRLAALSYDGVELMGDLAAYADGEGGGLATGRVLADNGLKVFSLTPDNVDLAHPDAVMRGQAVDYYLQLLDFAAELGKPLVSCHGFVGRVRPLTSQAEERQLLLEAVGQIADRAKSHDLRLIFEVLNRYESHLVNTGQEALAFIDDLARNNMGVLLDAYHMNIEEADPAGAIRQVGSKLWLYHAADSNRGAVGRGHTDFGEQLRALQDIGYQGPIILECTAPGPDPFSAIKDEGSLAWLETYLRESRDFFLGELRRE